MKKIYAILFVGALLFSCKKNDVMDRTIFIPDEDNYRLPAYTEWGYNSFGAEYEREYFLAESHIVPCKVLYNGNNKKMQFSLHGTTYSCYNTVLVFTFPFEQMLEYKDLEQLNNVKINLADKNCMVKMIRDTVETTLDVLDGELYFKRAQLLSIDDKENRVILSGTFEVLFLQKGFPMSFSNGRFDVGITKNVFYAN